MDVAQLEAVRAHLVDVVEQRTNPLAEAVNVLHRSLGDAAAGGRRVLVRVEHGNLHLVYFILEIIFTISICILTHHRWMLLEGEQQRSVFGDQHHEQMRSLGGTVLVLRPPRG